MQPIIVVVGEKESKSKSFTPRFRTKMIGKENKAYKLDELYNLVCEYNSGFPQSRIPLSVHMSKRPKFK